MTYNDWLVKCRPLQCPLVSKMSGCFCVRLDDDEVELVLDVDASGYELLTEEKDDVGYRTPLHWAAAMGQSQAVTSLLEFNANPSPVDAEQGTPLEYARQSGHAECVQILEERLGLRGPNGSLTTSSEPGANQDVEAPKVKKGPLGFIVDLFKPKKSKQNINNDLANDNPKTHGHGSSDEQGNVCPNNNLNAKSRSDKDKPRLTTPKKVKEPEMIISMEKLQVSREDNPVIKQTRPKRDQYELGEIQQSHSQNVPLGAVKSVLPSSVANTNLDHSHLIRSPPPNLKRTGSPRVGALQREKDHGRLEEDAATILALQRCSTAPSPAAGGVSASKSLSPISKAPDPHVYSRRAQTTTPSTTYAAVSPGGESASSSRSYPSQLAPLKGPVPPGNSPRVVTNPPITNRRLEDLRAEPPASRRMPTPPPPPSTLLDPRPSKAAPAVNSLNGLTKSPQQEALVTPVSQELASTQGSAADSLTTGADLAPGPPKPLDESLSHSSKDFQPLATSAPGDQPAHVVDNAAAAPQRKKKKKKKALAAGLEPAIPRPPHRPLGDPYLDAGESIVARRALDRSVSDTRHQVTLPLQPPPIGDRLKP